MVAALTEPCQGSGSLADISDAAKFGVNTTVTDVEEYTFKKSFHPTGEVTIDRTVGDIEGKHILWPDQYQMKKWLINSNLVWKCELKVQVSDDF